MPPARRLPDFDKAFAGSQSFQKLREEWFKCTPERQIGSVAQPYPDYLSTGRVHLGQRCKVLVLGYDYCLPF